MTKKLKAVFVITSVDGYGADKSILANIIYLKNQEKLEPFVIIPKNGKINEALSKENIPFCTVKFTSWIVEQKALNSRLFVFKRWAKCKLNVLLSYLILIKHYKKVSACTVVHTNTLGTNLGIFLSKLIVAKHIMHIREIPYEQFEFQYEYEEERFFKVINESSAMVLCNSEYTLKSFSKHIGENKLSIVPNPIFEKLKDRGLKVLNKNSKIKFIIAGRFEDAKNQFDALKASKRLIDNNFSNFELYMFGGGPLYNKYYDYINDHGLKSHVFIKGFVPNLAEILKHFDIGIMCSRYEAFGRVTIEYMINQLPVIGNNTGNTPNLIKDGINGFIYNHKNDIELYEKMAYFLNKPEDILEMGKMAKRYVSREYSTSYSSEKLLDELTK